jgi:hypothetical protein
MPHDMELVPQVAVNDAEYQKFCYLIKCLDAVDRAHGLALKYSNELKVQDGTQAEMKFDWRGIVHFVQPQLQVVFLQDAHPKPIDKTFVEFPFAVIVVRTAVVVELETMFELCLEDGGSHQGAGDLSEQIRRLESSVRALEGQRAQNALATVRQLKRVLRVE